MTTMNNNDKVFVAQYSSRMNFQNAQGYGEVIFLTAEEFRAEPAMPEVNARIKSEMENILTGYIPGRDYMLLTGSPIPTVIVGMHISKTPGLHKILKWNNQTRVYDLVRITV